MSRGLSEPQIITRRNGVNGGPVEILDDFREAWGSHICLGISACLSFSTHAHAPLAISYCVCSEPGLFLGGGLRIAWSCLSSLSPPAALLCPIPIIPGLLSIWFGAQVLVAAGRDAGGRVARGRVARG